MGRLLSSRVAASLLLFVSIATSAQAPVQSQTQTETKKSGTGKQAVKSILVQPGVLPAAGTQRPQPGQPSGTPGYSLQPPLTLNPTVTATLLPPETDQKVRVTISWAQPGVDAEKCIIKWGDQTASDACGQDYTDHTYAAPKTYLIQVVASGYVNDRPFTSIGRTVIRIAVPPPSDGGTVQPEPSPTTQANPEPTPTLEGTPEPSQGSKGKPKPPPNVKGKPEKPPGQYPVLTPTPFWHWPFGLIQWLLVLLGVGVVVGIGSRLFHTQPSSAELHVRGFSGTSLHEIRHTASAARGVSLMLKPGVGVAEHRVVFPRSASASK